MHDFRFSLTLCTVLRVLIVIWAIIATGLTLLAGGPVDPLLRAALAISSLVAHATAFVVVSGAEAAMLACQRVVMDAGGRVSGFAGSAAAQHGEANALVQLEVAARDRHGTASPARDWPIGLIETYKGHDIHGTVRSVFALDRYHPNVSAAKAAIDREIGEIS